VSASKKEDAAARHFSKQGRGCCGSAFQQARKRMLRLGISASKEEDAAARVRKTENEEEEEEEKEEEKECWSVIGSMLPIHVLLGFWAHLILTFLQA
jgi:hypothetical protein